MFRAFRVIGCLGVMGFLWVLGCFRVFWGVLEVWGFGAFGVF